MAINVKGVWLAMKYEIPAMLATAGGGEFTCVKEEVVPKDHLPEAGPNLQKLPSLSMKC